MYEMYVYIGTLNKESIK